MLLGLAGVRVLHQGPIFEKYRIGPEVSLNLLADGLSLPVALIINLICLALAIYSLHYVDHRIELIYRTTDPRTSALYHKRFFFLYLFFPTGFMGVAFSTNLIYNLFVPRTAHHHSALLHHGAVRVFRLYHPL